MSYVTPPMNYAMPPVNVISAVIGAFSASVSATQEMGTAVGDISTNTAISDKIENGTSITGGLNAMTGVTRTGNYASTEASHADKVRPNVPQGHDAGDKGLG